MERTIGIILRTIGLHANKLIIFDQLSGAIQVTCLDTMVYTRIKPGFVVMYGFHRRNTTWIEHVEIIHDAMPLMSHDLYFVHHLLELCYYFLPPHDQHRALFDLLLELFGSHASISLTILQKKMILLRFFACLGMYPEGMEQHRQLLNDLIYGPFSVMLKHMLPSEVEQSINQWLMQCLMAHPQYAQFKTKFNRLSVME